MMSPPKDVVFHTEEYFAEQDKGTLKDEQVRISKGKIKIDFGEFLWVSKKYQLYQNPRPN